MSTRSMTLVQQRYDSPDDFIPLYRHCDGYLSEAGKAILKALDTDPAPLDCEQVLARLLAERYDYEGNDCGPIYRAATWMPDKQGDLEHVYVLRYDLDPEAEHLGPRLPARLWTVTHYHREAWGDDDYRKWPNDTYTVEQFRDAVAKDSK